MQPAARIVFDFSAFDNSVTTIIDVKLVMLSPWNFAQLRFQPATLSNPDLHDANSSFYRSTTGFQLSDCICTCYMQPAARIVFDFSAFDCSLITIIDVKLVMLSPWSFAQLRFQPAMLSILTFMFLLWCKQMVLPIHDWISVMRVQQSFCTC
jgi:hypothetical protein